MHKRKELPGITRRNIMAMASIFGSAALAGMSGSSSALAKNDKDKDKDKGDDQGGNGSCFLRGTRIWTPCGECRVEGLKINDLVITSSGETQPIVWIGRRAHERPSGQQWPEAVHPVRVAQSALGRNVPHRDLYLSPYHSLYLDGVLIPAVDLLNDSTIARSGVDMTEIEYFHIKLERHSVIYAEGAACETLLGEPSAYWENLAEYRKLYEEPSPSVETPFAPVLGYNGRRSMLRGRIRSAISPVIDVRSKLEIVRDHLEARAASNR